MRARRMVQRMEGYARWAVGIRIDQDRASRSKEAKRLIRLESMNRRDT